MSKMQGPGIFLAQFVGVDAPFDSLANMAKWAGDLGSKGVQFFRSLKVNVLATGSPESGLL